MPEVSIVMTAYRRSALLRRTLESIFRQQFSGLEVIVVEDGDDAGWTRGACEEFGAHHFQRKNRPDTPYANPSVPVNIGLRRATGDVIVLQNAECEHISPNTIELLTAPHREKSNLAVFAAVMAMRQDGSESNWYCHPKESPRPFFFCGSLRREWVEKLRGFDERFKWYGFDDDFWALCLQFSGVEFVFRDDIRVNHNWHESAGFCYGIEFNGELYNEQVRALLERRRTPTSNLDREWGSLES